MGYSAEDLISNIFRVCKNSSINEPLKLDFIKVKFTILYCSLLYFIYTINSILHYKGRNTAIANECEVCNRCVSSLVMYTILCASGAETRFSVITESNGMLCIPLQKNIM